jgi:hypothetical protein
MVNNIIKNFSNIKIGYGNPNGNFWFIGPEEGGSIKGNKDRIETWAELGEKEHFHDMKEFHLSLSKRKEYDSLNRFFIGEKSKLQSTWNGIMKILLPLNQIENTLQIRREYQSQQLGSRNGDTIIAELFQLSSKSLDDKDCLEYFGRTKKEYWQDYAPLRETLLCNQIRKYKPKVVCFYSTSFIENWYRRTKELNTDFHDYESINYLPMRYFKNSEILFVIIPHPIARSMNGNHEKIGLAIKKFIQ